MTLVCLSRPVLRLQVLPCLAPPRLASSCRVLSCCVLSLFCGVWSCPVLPCLALSCPALPCVFLPCLVLSYFFVLKYQQAAIGLCSKTLCYHCFLKRTVEAYFC